MHRLDKMRQKPLLFYGALLLLGLVALKVFAGMEFSTQHVSGLFDRWDLLVLMIAAYSTAFALRAYGWKWVLNFPVATARLFHFQMIGLLLNHLFPFKSGEAAKIYLLKESGCDWSRAATSVLASRWVDLLALGFIFLFCGSFSMDLLAVEARLAGFLLGVLIGLGVLFHFFSKIGLPNFAAKIIGKKATDFVHRLRQAVQSVRGLDIFRAFCVAVAGWVLEAVVLWVVAQSAGIHLSFAGCIAATSFTILTQSFSLTPGGIGTYEGGMTAALSFLGLDLKTGLTLALVSHGFKFLYSYLFGAISLGLLDKDSINIRMMLSVKGNRMIKLSVSGSLKS